MPHLANGAFEFCGIWGEVCPGFVSGKSVSSALLWDLKSTTFFSDIAKKLNIPVEPLIYQTIIHESFHLFGQHLNRSGWPTQYSDPGFEVRKEINRRCYVPNATVHTLRDKEVDSIFKVAQKVFAGASNQDVQTALKQFLTLRWLRYQELSGTLVSTDSGNVNCATAEDLMEMEEGLTESIADQISIASGILTPQQVLRIERLAPSLSSNIQSFYAFGTFETMALSYLEGGLTPFATRLFRDKSDTLAKEMERASSATIYGFGKPFNILYIH